MFELPVTITIDGIEHPIRNNGDYKMVLDCFSALEDKELTKQERAIACLVIFYAELEDVEDIALLGDTEQAVKKMYEFFNCGQSTDIGMKVNYKLIDWEKDQQLIASAVNNVAGSEIRLQSYIHWWTFMGYYMGIGECTLSTIVGIRYKIATNKKLEKYEKEFKRDNPQYFTFDLRSTKDQSETDEMLKELWNQS